MALSPSGWRWWAPRRWSRQDRAAVLVLLSLPVVVFVLPALAGHPAVVGDNLLQNYPLRVLAGAQLRAGHWPLWNPYSDSGTPLLGGMNAGALYPGTLLFAVLPGLVAWVANLLVVWWAAGVGLYALARTVGVRELAAALAAVTYAFGGTMVGQLIHLGVVQGQSLLPWLVLSQLALGRVLLGATRGTPRPALARAAMPGALGLTATVGLVCLTGEPRAMADALVVAVVVAACELLAHGSSPVATWRGRVAYGATTVVAAAWGVALGAVQLAPGWGFVTLSDRSRVTYGFFAAGSLSARWLSLLVVQGLLGTNGLLGTPQYFGSYYLSEVTVYVGLASLVAVAAFAAQLVGRRSRAPRRRLVAFLVLVVAGALLAVAPSTALGPVLHAVPFLGSTRLQSRNLAVLDLGATVLLAWWLDAVVAGRRREASLEGPRLAVSLLPVAAAAVLCVTALASPSFVTATLLGVRGSAASAAGIRPVVAVSLAIALAYGVALCWSSGRRPRAPVRALLGVLAVDLVCFNVLFTSGLIAGVASVTPSDAVAAAAFGTTGRHAIADPAVLDYHAVVPLGLANLGVFTHEGSVQGYGSLHGAAYAAATGTRLLGRLDGCALARGVFVPLRLSAIAAATNALVSTPGTQGAVSTCGRPRSVRRAARYFGSTLHVASVELRGTGLRDVTVTLLGADGGDGATEHLAGTRSGRVLVASFPSRPVGAGVVVTSRRPFTLAATTLAPSTGPPERLDTWLQVGLDEGRWRLVAVHGPISLFRARSVRPAVWLLGDPGGSARVTASADTGTTTVLASTTRASTLVWSEAWLPGWEATATTGTGRSITLDVRPHGLVQGVALPAGRWHVVFAYDAPRFTEGLVWSTAALALLAAALAVLAASSLASRRRRAVPRAGPHDPGGPVR